MRALHINALIRVQLAMKLSRQFRTTSDAVTNIKNQLEANYAKFDNSSMHQTCCDYKSADSTFHPGFNTTVGLLLCGRVDSLFERSHIPI